MNILQHIIYKLVTPERQTSSNKHLCTNLPQCNRKSFLTPQPNKTKPPLQVLAVVEGNSEKNKVWDGTRDGAINYIKFYLYSITHSVILISYRRLGWSLARTTQDQGDSIIPRIRQLLPSVHTCLLGYHYSPYPTHPQGHQVGFLRKVSKGVQ